MNTRLFQHLRGIRQLALAEAIPLELEPWQVIVNLRSLNAPTTKGSRIETDPDTIFIEDSRGGVDALLNRPEVIKIPKDGLHFLEIYFPMPQSSRRERSEFLNANEDLARSTLFESL